MPSRGVIWEFLMQNQPEISRRSLFGWGVGQHPWTFLLSCGSKTITLEVTHPGDSKPLAFDIQMRWRPFVWPAVGSSNRAKHASSFDEPHTACLISQCVTWADRDRVGAEGPKNNFNAPGFGPGLVSHQKKQMHGMLPIWESQNWCQMSGRRAGKRKDHGETDNIFGGKWTWSPDFTDFFWGVPCNGCNNHS